MCNSMALHYYDHVHYKCNIVEPVFNTTLKTEPMWSKTGVDFGQEFIYMEPWRDGFQEVVLN